MFDMNALEMWLKGASSGEKFVVTHEDVVNMRAEDIPKFNKLLSEMNVFHSVFEYSLVSDSYEIKRR